MLLVATILKPYMTSTTKEYFSSEEDQLNSMDSSALILILMVILFGLISAYGAARLSYYYNISIGNSGSAIFWSVLAFIFSDFYYPYYSFFLSSLSGKRGNNIVIS